MTATSLNQQIRDLPRRMQLAFAATLCERMLPNYQLFSDATEFGDAAVLRNCLNAIWDASRKTKPAINAERWQTKLDACMPDPEQFDIFGVGPAIDAVASLAALIDGLNESDYPAAVEISRVSRSCVKQYLLFSEGEDVALKDHPLMQYEFALQEELVDFLAGAKPGDTLQRQIREAFLSEGLSNLGLSPGSEQKDHAE
jgi:uncharacterized protein YjaG (DUF416 family)